MFSKTRTQNVFVSSPSILQVVIFIISLHVASISTSAANATDDDANANEDTEDAEVMQVRVHAMMLNKTSSKITYNKDGVITVNEDHPLNVDLFGDHLDRIEKVKFITTKGVYGGPCDSSESAHFQSREIEVGPMEGKVDFLPLEKPQGLRYISTDDTYYLCVKTINNADFVHQGDSSKVQIRVQRDVLPDWVKIIFVVVCLFLSGTFSGLNLGLMSLDKTELKIIQNCGSDKERGYAKAIMPVRIHGNFLLCSILLGNVLVNNSLTIMLDLLLDGGGAIAVVFATLAIVIFGEIIPQAVCSRHGLAVGAYTIWLTKLFMLLTAPLSFPLSKLLDYCLGSEIGTVYNKLKLMELIKITDGMNDLDKEEVNMVTGALVLSKKSVKDVMTNLNDCYMLQTDKVLNFETVSEIKSQGYSRIPVYEGDRTNVVYILFAKDLLFLDTDDEKTVEEVCKFYKNEPNFVYDDTVLTDMFNDFKTGEKGHMAIVQAINNEGEGDPYYEVIGLVTLEDIIEEIVQSEIVDETDIIMDNKSKKKRKSRYRKDADLRLFAHKCQHHVTISPQMSLAVLQFLTTNVRAFHPDNFSQRVLQKLLSMDVYREVKVKFLKPGEKSGDEGVIMKKGVACDFFVLIIEGRVEVTIGKEQKTFQEGPFSCFGEQMLEFELKGSQTWSSLTASERSLVSNQSKVSQWTPDYKLKAVTDVIYLKIRKGIYNLAVKANKLNSLNSESESNLKENELVEALTKETKNDAEFDSLSLLQSPEKLREEVLSLQNLRKSTSSLVTKFPKSPTGEHRTDYVQDEDEHVLHLEEETLDDCSSSMSPKMKDNKVIFMIAHTDNEDVIYNSDLTPERTSLLHSEHKVT